MNERIKSNLISVLLSAMFIGIGLVLPFLTGQIQYVGNMLLPMHLPVMLCGLICGWKYGFAVGLILPLMRSMIFTMPVLYPSAIAMSFELATYGLVLGYLFYKAKWKCIKSLIRCMLISMLVGRAVWGLAMAVLVGFSAEKFSFYAFLSGAFLVSFPGIILQLLLIPTIMLLLHRTHIRNVFEKKKNYEKI